MSFLHALAVSALVSSARANMVDCTEEPDKCKHADSCDTCGVHPGSEWAYCDSTSVLGVEPTVESENGEAGDGGSGYEKVMNCRQLDYEFKDTFKASMCDSFCSGECKYQSCSLNTKHVRIIVGSTAGGILLLLTIWIWCCCRKRGKKNIATKNAKMDAMEMKVTSKREERQDSRRADRDDRLSGMRAKYGLKSNNDGYKDDLIGNDDY